jgi:hypothetical protein
VGGPGFLFVVVLWGRGRAGALFPVAKLTEGGLSPTADIGSVTFTNGQITVNWSGLRGPYVLEGKSALDGGAWTALPNDPNGTSHSVPASGSLGFFRVRTPSPAYVGSDTCGNCHMDTHDNWLSTIHSGAMDVLTGIGMGDNAACVKCHSVGAGFPGGFTSNATTPQFAGVQCENCHGPGGAHAAAPNDLTLRPKVAYSSELCGGCHNDYHHPTFENWSEAAHAKVDPHVAGYFLDPNPVTAAARMNSCGACHSGATRLALVKAAEQGTAVTLPTSQEAATIGITCVACHDPHKPNLDGSASLRNPTYSTNFFSYSTATTTTFAAQYDPKVQMCAQCHNQRGALPTDTSRPPHHSGQYNMLIGDIGVGLIKTAPHSKAIDQCTTCHVHRSNPAEPTETDPVVTGHSFEPTLAACVACHTDQPTAQSKLTSVQTEIKGKIAEVKGLLDQWAQIKAPADLRAKYGALVWEYTSPGQISNPSGSASIVGPSTAEQANVPTDIKNARMYLYMVEHDGSYGVHNSRYARLLLDTAKTTVTTLLSAP